MQLWRSRPHCTKEVWRRKGCTLTDSSGLTASHIGTHWEHMTCTHTGMACPSSPLLSLSSSSSTSDSLCTAGLTRQCSSWSPPGSQCWSRVVRGWSGGCFSSGGQDRMGRGSGDPRRTRGVTRQKVASFWNQLGGYRKKEQQ